MAWLISDISSLALSASPRTRLRCNGYQGTVERWWTERIETADALRMPIDWRLCYAELLQSRWTIQFGNQDIMRPALRLLARASSLSPRGSALDPLSSALLPPLQLYRRILRTHRKVLPPEMRLLGDEYVKSEFKLHKDVDNPVHIVSEPCRFLRKWSLNDG